MIYYALALVFICYNYQNMLLKFRPLLIPSHGKLFGDHAAAVLAAENIIEQTRESSALQVLAASYLVLTIFDGFWIFRNKL